MFNDAFRGLAQNKEIDLFPRDIAAEQEKLSDFHLRQDQQRRLQGWLYHQATCLRTRLQATIRCP